jgi:hypothetical protein
MMWLQNLDNAGSEPGSAVGPGAGLGIMLLGVGRTWWLTWFALGAAQALGVW